MLAGVTFFSSLMVQFIDIVQNIKIQGFENHQEDLYKWILLLKRFKGGTPLPKSLKKEIFDHFSYFWENNRTQALLEKKEYFDSLPRYIRNRVITEYLYKDLFRDRPQYSPFFSLGKLHDSNFAYEVSFGLQPRLFNG